MDRIEMVSLINKCWEAVEESKASNIIAEDRNGTKIYNTLPYQAFMQLLASELPHISLTTMKQSGNLDMKIDEPGDTWKKES